MKTPKQYSESFCGGTRANAYEKLYEKGTADEAIWRIEREFLSDFLARNSDVLAPRSYLDFACGTGRVISFLEDLMGSSRGIDISLSMLEVARQKVRRSELLCVDITSDAAPKESYDLITAFRFFLNADRPLRAMVMEALGDRLKNGHSRLIFSNHGNPWSYKALTWPFHRCRQFIFGWRPSGNYWTDRQVRSLDDESGLCIVERFGCGIVSPKLFHLAPSLSHFIERTVGSSFLGRALGVNQIYVVARK